MATINNFNQPLFRKKKYVNIENGDNIIRLMPHKEFASLDVDWYTYHYCYIFSSKYAKIPDYKGDPIFHKTCDGSRHNCSNVYNQSYDLIKIYNAYVSDCLTDKFSDAEDRKPFFRNYFLFAQKRVHFYACRYENGYSEAEEPPVSLLEMPVTSFDKFREFLEEEMDKENKATNPNSSYIFNIKRTVGDGPVSYSFKILKDKKKVDGKVSETPMENTLTEGQIAELNELVPIDMRFMGAYNRNQFDRQFEFLQWYDEHIFVPILEAKSIIERDEFKNSWTNLKDKMDEEEQLERERLEGTKQVVSHATSAVIDTKSKANNKAGSYASSVNKANKVEMDEKNDDLPF